MLLLITGALDWMTFKGTTEAQQFYNSTTSRFVDIAKAVLELLSHAMY